MIYAKHKTVAGITAALMILVFCCGALVSQTGFPRICIELHTAEKIHFSNARLHVEKNRLLISDTDGTERFSLQKIKRVRYSAGTMKKKLAFYGAGAGALLTMLSWEQEERSAGNAFVSGSSLPGTNFKRFILLVPGLSLAGYLLGSRIYTGWKEIDLRSIGKNRIASQVEFFLNGIAFSLQFSPVR